VNGPLRIGVDARELLGDATGVGRYLGELIRRWTARSDAATRRFMLYTPEALPLALPPSAVEFRIGGKGRGTWWEQMWLRRAVRDERPDVFFAPAYTAPLGTGVPTVITIHDIAFTAHPEWFRLREGLRRRWLTERGARSAALVLTVSDFSREEIERHFGIEGGRILVIREGLAPRTAGAAPASRREPLVLYVGSIFNRRRLPDLIGAFARATRDIAGARLVIVGDDRSWPRLNLPAVVYAHGVERKVEIRRYVEDEELARLYAEASVFGFLSEYEGFGITPLEALAAGVPSVVLDTPVAREIYGDAAVYVPPDDQHATADAIRRLLTVAAERDAVLAHAPAVLARYSWDSAAAATLAAIEGAARR
jgi:glycosyltransferase involved in cell wall biosynthesis